MKTALFTLLLLLATTASAENDWSIRAAVGSASASDFDELYYFSGLNTSSLKTHIYGVEGGYRLAEDIFEWPIDIYVKGGLNYFDENGHQANFFEGTLYVKFYVKLNAFENQLRFGIAEGVSYAGRSPYVEKLEAEEEGDNVSKLLNYMEITFDIDLGRLTGYPSLKETYFGYMIKHRSGVQGYYGGVSDGGSNYNALYIETNF
ncbi:MAG: hypothetical protein L3J28_15230 [Candidatus Polarisedimenticolaceae bacterium]|nr:hypothetical protein [Candidatus Polarisedimenticolaceae bacterium]